MQYPEAVNKVIGNSQFLFGFNKDRAHLNEDEELDTWDTTLVRNIMTRLMTLETLSYHSSWRKRFSLINYYGCALVIVKNTRKIVFDLNYK